MAKTLQYCGVRVFQVQFFGMKWVLPEAEPITDYLIQRYIDIMDGNAARSRNLFDIDTVHHNFENETLLKLTPQQTQHLAGEVHEILIIRDFGSMEFKLKITRM